jgi:DNA invertase Pin-like site-specific DNA recombinase
MSVKTIAYLRISTAAQDCNNQRLAILDYAHQHKMTIDEFISIQVSSRKTLKQRGILELLDSLEPKDILLVSELSRLGRSVGQIIQMVDYLVKNQIRLVAIKESIELSGKQDIPTKVMITMFSLFAEIERDLISERTREGIAAARARGKVIGRPKGALGKSKLDGKEEEIQLLLKKEVGITSIAKIMEVSRTALRHFIRTRKLS